MKLKLIAFLVALLLVFFPISGVGAATTADVTVNATPAYITISVSPTTYGFGVINVNTTSNSTTTYFTITNGSTVLTDNTISVTSSTWTGGIGWTHSDTCTPAEDTVGMKANKGGTWGTGDVIVKYSLPNILADDQAVSTNWNFGLSLHAATAYNDSDLKTNTVRITATMS